MAIQPEIATLAEWEAYVVSPTGATLGPLLNRVDLSQRGTLFEMLASLAGSGAAWRVHQHLALLHLGALAPFSEEIDSVRALYFATRACTLSEDEPAAVLCRAWVSWMRRVPLAVLHDIGVADRRIAEVRMRDGSATADRLQAEFDGVHGAARAYLGEVEAALALMRKSADAGCLKIDFAVQLLLSAEPDFPDASVWAVEFLPADISLAGHAAAKHRRAQRRRLIRTIGKRLL